MTFGSRRSMVVRASSSAESAGSPESSAASIAPLQLESPVGQLLSQILVSHPHLVPAAVEQQLEQLKLIVMLRIRKRSLLHLALTLYCSGWLNYFSIRVSPLLYRAPGRVDGWPSQDEKLERLHSPEAYEMIQNHLALILGNRVGDTTSVAQISKLRVGQVYAASVMYGYFLKRVDHRFQLEKTIKILPNASDEEEISIRQAVGEDV
ncbi:hypothetical protein HS088_TW15G00082 [Tripterygium wilfordii]|uniref:UV-B-induced protein n=1 Tax=Tripterygium wilfordii TaxID=458696 RepID=A0A7J7CKK7_TRIWF|nr:hypothetical protein HS088_TW15G00082 [Tripterygium wilfordii]